MAVVRMKDIARDLGVSAVTVSKVLRNHPDIGQATRDRVLQRVKEMRYRPNLMARGLVTGSHVSGCVACSGPGTCVFHGNCRIGFEPFTEARIHDVDCLDCGRCCAAT